MKALSSPKRAETFRPPLMKFLKHNNGSRRKSRPTPIFHLPKPTKIEISQDPSSPKVTCIGQVVKPIPGGGAAVTRRREFKKALFSGKPSSRFCNNGFRRLFRKWGLFFRTDYCRKIDAVEDCFRVRRENAVDERESCGAQNQEIGTEIVDDDCSFPMGNNLILKRCRSVPYRSSSLGGLFLAEKDGKTGDLGKSRIIEECSNEFDGNGEDLEGIVGSTVHPLVLTKCKSETFRREERVLKRFG